MLFVVKDTKSKDNKEKVTHFAVIFDQCERTLEMKFILITKVQIRCARSFNSSI